jgi:hypothetical protein
VNLNVRAIVAALNHALDLGHLGNPAAWKLKALRFIPSAMQEKLAAFKA